MKFQIVKVSKTTGVSHLVPEESETARSLWKGSFSKEVEKPHYSTVHLLCVQA